MDSWLTNAGKPATLTDGCWTPTGQLVSEPATWHGSGTCNTLYPSAGDTRIAAGASTRDDTLKCRLVPLNFASYPVSFSADQQARLHTAFPGGVCDYGSKGVGQVLLGEVGGLASDPEQRPRDEPAGRAVEPGLTDGQPRR